jgi:hypothetical protein
LLGHVSGGVKQRLCLLLEGHLCAHAAEHTSAQRHTRVPVYRNTSIKARDSRFK